MGEVDPETMIKSLKFIEIATLDLPIANLLKKLQYDTLSLLADLKSVMRSQTTVVCEC